MRRKEGTIQRRILKRINETFGPSAYMFQTDGTSYVGTPDLVGVILGRSVWIEVKCPGKKPRPLQLAVAAQVRRAGGITIVGYDPQQVIDELKSNGIINLE